MNHILNDIQQGLIKSITFSGRATRREFWTFYGFVLLTTIVLLIMEVLMEVLFGRSIRVSLIAVVLLVPLISVAVRRLHDVNLSGFWMWYLTPVGLPIIYLTYILDLDPTGDQMIEKIQKIGSCWLGWILTILFWGIGAPITLFLIFLYAGKKEDNAFGPNPYTDQKTA